MKSPEEMDAFLADEIAPRLRRIESERRAVQARRDGVALHSAWKILGTLAGLALAAWSKALFPLIVGVGAPWAIEAWRRSRIPDTASPMVRAQIIEPVVGFLDPSFRYQPKGLIARSEFEASRLFAGESFNHYEGEDLVRGRHGSTDFRFCELRVKQVDRKKRRTESRIVFEGLFLVADCNKSFRGQTVVVPDVAERKLGTFGRAFQSLGGVISPLALVELEDPLFERAFKVTSSDPVEARYLLSTSLMQRILAFREATGSGLRIGFVRGGVYVALPMSFDLMAIDPSKPLDLDHIRKWIGEIRFAVGIIDDLDLNTRIWSKAAPAA